MEKQALENPYIKGKKYLGGDTFPMPTGRNRRESARVASNPNNPSNQFFHSYSYSIQHFGLGLGLGLGFHHKRFAFLPSSFTLIHLHLLLFHSNLNYISIYSSFYFYFQLFNYFLGYTAKKKKKKISWDHS